MRSDDLGGCSKGQGKAPPTTIRHGPGTQQKQGHRCLPQRRPPPPFPPPGQGHGPRAVRVFRPLPAAPSPPHPHGGPRPPRSQRCFIFYQLRLVGKVHRILPRPHGPVRSGGGRGGSALAAVVRDVIVPRDSLHEEMCVRGVIVHGMAFHAWGVLCMRGARKRQGCEGRRAAGAHDVCGEWACVRRAMHECMRGRLGAQAGRQQARTRPRSSLAFLAERPASWSLA